MDPTNSARREPAEPGFADLVVDLTRRRAAELDEQTMALVLALMRAGARHRHTFERRVHLRGGRHLRAFGVLYLVWLFDQLSARDLARRLGMSRQTTSAVLGGLHADGLIIRERDRGGDRRLLLVRLTDAGRLAVEREFRAQHELDAEWVGAALAPEEQGLLRLLLERLVAAQEPGAPAVAV